MITNIVAGLTLGFGAGISPGPLTTLVIAESLRGGRPAGFRVAIAPLITDSVLIAAALLLMAPMPPWGVALVSVAGGGIIIWMGWGTIRSTAPVMAEAAAAGARSPWHSLGKAVVTNLLNPHALLFWVSVGGPLLTEAYQRDGWAGPAAFMAAFFLVLVGAKLLLAVMVSAGRRYLQGPAYRWAMAVAGAALGLMGLWQVWRGVRFFL